MPVDLALWAPILGQYAGGIPAAASPDLNLSTIEQTPGQVHQSRLFDQLQYDFAEQKKLTGHPVEPRGPSILFPLGLDLALTLFKLAHILHSQRIGNKEKTIAVEMFDPDIRYFHLC